MADNKQYITQSLDSGSIQISDDVIASIVALSVKEVDGVVTLNMKPGADIADMLGAKGWGKGMKIEISEDNEISVTCEVLVGYDQNVLSIANAVQESITSHLESMTGVKVKSVNVHVCGIIRQ